eukprot:5543800-Amphidinium_carterae.1
MHESGFCFASLLAAALQLGHCSRVPFCLRRRKNLFCSNRGAAGLKSKRVVAHCNSSAFRTSSFLKAGV